MRNRELKVRTRTDTPVEGTIRFVSMTLGARGAARVRMDDMVASALAAAGGPTKALDPTPTELSFVGDTELDALALAEAWVRKIFQVVEVRTDRGTRSDTRGLPGAQA